MAFCVESTPNRSSLSAVLLRQAWRKGKRIRRSLPHGHVAAVLGLCQQLGLPRILHRSPFAPAPASSLSPPSPPARSSPPPSSPLPGCLSPDSDFSCLGSLRGLGPVSGNELLAMLDWLRQRQSWTQRSLARRHLRDGTLIL